MTSKMQSFMEEMPGPGNYFDCVDFPEFTNPYGTPSFTNPFGLVSKKQINNDNLDVFKNMYCNNRNNTVIKYSYISIDLAIVTLIIYLCYILKKSKPKI